MSDLVPTAPANVTIVVFGEQGSGKTIFLTCIFQSIWTACPDDVVLDFDRESIGNADYFQEIEERLITKASTKGTDADRLIPARIYVKPYEPLPDTLPPVLSVDILDFAGRHFRSLANLKGLGTSSILEGDDVKVFREVNETLKRADAFIILINSKEIDPLDETPKRNPFTPSVNTLLSHCRTEKKPVALLFSQVDQTRRLTEEMFRTLPRVQAFERQFTPDHEEAAIGARPFGIVRRIACYQTVEGDLAPIRQTLDGSIWRPEPAQVVLDLLKAAMPQINDRLRAEAERIRLQQEERERAARHQRTIRLITAAAILAGLLLIVGFSFLFQYRQRENGKIALLASVESHITQGRIAAITPPMESSLGAILNGYRSNRSGASDATRAAIRNIHAAFGEAARRLAEEPSLNQAYAAELVRFRGLAPVFDPEQTADWRELLPLLEARATFLSEWFANEHEGFERTLILDAAARHFSTADQKFARVLAEQSSRGKHASVAVWPGSRRGRASRQPVLLPVTSSRSLRSS